MALNDNDKFLINDGTTTETITLAQLKDGSMINDTDMFLINDGTTTEKVSYAELKAEIGGGSGTAPVIQSVALSKSDPGSSGFTNRSFNIVTTMQEEGSPESTKLIQVYSEGDFNSDISTSTILSITDLGGSQAELTFSNALNFGLFEVGDYLTQGDDNAAGTIVSINAADRKLVVQDSSQVWENYLTFTPPAVENVNRPSAHLFNGLLGGAKEDLMSSSSNFDLATETPDWTWTPPNPIAATTVRIYLTNGTNPTDDSGYRIIDTDDNVGAWSPNQGVGSFNVQLSQPPNYTGFVKSIQMYARGGFLSTTGLRRSQTSGVEINGTVLVSSGASVWAVGQILTKSGGTVTGKRFFNLDAGLNVISIVDGSAPWVQIPGNSLSATVSVPSTFIDGTVPDTVLPAGSPLTAEVRATNGVDPDSQVLSNTITP